MLDYLLQGSVKELLGSWENHGEFIKIIEAKKNQINIWTVSGRNSQKKFVKNLEKLWNDYCSISRYDI